LIALLVPETHSATVRDFWQSITLADEIVGAQLLLPECTSIFREKASTGQLTHNESIEVVQKLTRLPIRISLAAEQFTRAVDLANRTRRLKAYDMQYVAVAEVENGELITLDGGPYQAAIEIGVPARLLR
jgi:predicted nucleic acid-binding protein